jgi:hypothetical protein
MITFHSFKKEEDKQEKKEKGRRDKQKRGLLQVQAHK